MPKLSYTYKVCIKCGKEYPEDATKCSCRGYLERVRRKRAPTCDARAKEWKQSKRKRRSTRYNI